MACTADLETFGGKSPEGRKVRGVLHWVDHDSSVEVEVRLYDQLFAVERPGTDGDFKAELNPKSLETLRGRVEPAVADSSRSHWQFERVGYFFRDPVATAIVFNRVVGLRESYAPGAESDTARAAVHSSVPALPTSAVVQADSGTKAGEHAATQVRGEERMLSPEVAARRDGLTAEFGIPEAQARTLAGDPAAESLFREAASIAPASAVANFVCNVVTGEMRATGKSLTGRSVGQIVSLLEGGTLGMAQAKRVLAVVLDTGEAPAAVVAREGLAKVDDEATLATWVEETFGRFPGEAGRFAGGEVKLGGFLVGQVLKASGGRADAAAVQRLVRARGQG